MNDQSYRRFLEWLRSEFVAGRIKARPMESFAQKGVITDDAGNIVTMNELETLYKQSWGKNESSQ